LRGAAAAVCLLAGATIAHAQDKKLEPVTMANPVVSLSFSLGYIADDLGLWAKHGLEVKTLEISGVGALNAVISGSVDFAQPSGPSFTRAASKGQRLLAIAMSTDRVSAQAVLRKDLAEAAGFDPQAPLEKRAQLLRGRTIAVESINSIIHAYALLLAKLGGYPADEIKIAVMQPPNMLAAFSTKAIDGFVMAPPWTQTPVLAGTAVRIASGPDGDPPQLVPFANTILVTRPETCDKRPAVCEGMGRSFAEAAAYVKDHPAEAIALVRGRFKTLDDKLLAAAFEVTRTMMPSPPIPTKEALENDEVINVDAGFIKPEDKLTAFDGLYTDRYVR
jgi:ABC-type nitrate/sulfonate/bicarbonate transport system substrate-binding protein